MVNKVFLSAFKNYMEYFVKTQVITEEQSNKMIDSFETKSFKFVTVVTAVGAVLIGLGILSYIASNWDHFTQSIKVILILFNMSAFYITGIKLEKKYFRVGKALQYISIFIYGGGLFLIDQIYNLNLNISNHFAIWIIGIIPIIWLQKDILTHLFGQVLTLMYGFMLLESYYDFENLKFSFMLGILILLTGFWIYINETKQHSIVSMFINNLLPIIVLINIFSYYDWNDTISTLIVLLYGVHLLYRPIISKLAPKLNRVQGIIVMGITGFMLSFENLWEELNFVQDGTVVAIIFSIIFIIYLFWLTRQGSGTSLIFICIFILRYYFDTFYDFLPKSIFFIIGGAILLAFGFYLERLSHKRGVELDVK